MAAIDTFKQNADQLDSPSGWIEAVTPHDTTTLARISRGIYVGVAGNVTVLTEQGQTVTFVGVPAGTILPIRVQRVNSTNTTATTMLALS